MPKKIKEKKPPEPYWNELVETWFQFCRLYLNESPSFDGSAPRDLKSIIIQLHTRCEKSNNAWNLESAKSRFYLFLKSAWDVPWLKDHWTLFNINRQKDIIFFNAAKNALHQAGK